GPDLVLANVRDRHGWHRRGARRGVALHTRPAHDTRADHDDAPVGDRIAHRGRAGNSEHDAGDARVHGRFLARWIRTAAVHRDWHTPVALEPGRVIVQRRHVAALSAP